MVIFFLPAVNFLMEVSFKSRVTVTFAEDRTLPSVGESRRIVAVPMPAPRRLPPASTVQTAGLELWKMSVRFATGIVPKTPEKVREAVLPLPRFMVLLPGLMRIGATFWSNDTAADAFPSV